MNNEHAFGLPPGSIRASLAIMLVVGTVYCVVISNLEGASVLSPLAVMVLKDYFDRNKEAKS